MIVRIGMETAEVVRACVRWPIGLEIHYRYKGGRYLTYATGMSPAAVTRAIVGDQCDERATPVAIT